MDEGKVFSLNGPEESKKDILTNIIRQGARKILREALEAEIEEVLLKFASLKTECGKQHIVRNVYLSERNIETGIGKGNLGMLIRL